MLSYVQTIPNTAKLQKWSNYDENDKNFEILPKPFETQQNYKSNQIKMNCIDLTSKRSKILSYFPNHSKFSKTTKLIKIQWIVHRFDVKTIKNVELRSNHSKLSKTTKVLKSRWIATIWRQNDQKCSVRFKPFQTQQNYKSDLITMKTIKNVELRSNHSKLSKTTKVLKSRWIATIWRQNDQKCSVRFKPFQTQQNYKSDLITMNCIDLTSKRSKMFSHV